MSQTYLRRLEIIRDDYHIARELSEFVCQLWHRQDMSGAFPKRTLARIRSAEESVGSGVLCPSHSGIRGRSQRSSAS